MLKRTLLLYFFLLLVLCHANRIIAQEIEISTPSEKSEKTFVMGTATAPNGETLLCNSNGFLLNGKQIIPVMGEFHYSRVNEADWERELLKMKAGGITIVSTYIFWIHHEEEKGIFDWNGNKNLRKFVETCKKLGLPVILRIGPFCHAEVRNGGVPEWIVDGLYKFRSTNKDFIEEVRLWYANIYNQIKGNLWKDGGAVIGIQLDNEYRGPWEYLEKLKEIALNIGFDVPIYTRTGWPQLSTPAPFGEALPLYGDYCDGFWDRTLKDMPGKYPGVYLFKSSRISYVIATEQFKQSDSSNNKTTMSYPYLTCELGGGMMTSYHRRININPLDIYAMTIVKIGSGSNLPGYYMYHGGTNPDGINHTLNENQATLYMNYNDLPVKNYDFQSPLGQYGLVNKHYYWLRMIHNFLADFGDDLSLMDVYLPENNVSDANDNEHLRWSVRSNGQSGYVFVNNFQRLRKLSDKEDVQFTLNLPKETVKFPQEKITVPSNTSFYFPFNIKTGGITIKYATAQPYAKINNNGQETIFLTAIKDIPVEILLSGSAKVKSKISYKETSEGILFANIEPGINCVIDIQNTTGKTCRIVIFDEETALQCYKVKAQKNEFMVLASNVVYYNNNNNLFFEQWDSTPISFMAYPSIPFKKANYKKKRQGIFTQYRFENSFEELNNYRLKTALIKKASIPREVIKGAQNVAVEPSDSDFDKLSEKWNISGLKNIANPEDYFLKITYEGDAARVYADDKLINDNFYNGKSMYVDVVSLLGEDITLDILPAKKEYPIYFQEDVRKEFEESNILLKLDKVELVKRNTVKLMIED